MPEKAQPKVFANKTIKISAVIAFVAVCLLLVFAYYDFSKVDTSVKVRLNAPFPAIDFAPFYVAKTKGMIEEALSKHSAEPDYVGSFGEIAISIESLATDRIDFILTSAIPALIGRAAGTDIKITWLSCVLYSEIVVDKNVSVDEFLDLRKLQIGTLTGSDSHYWLSEKLSNGVERDLSRFVRFFTRPTDVLAAFDQGSIQAIALFPPFPEQRLVTGAAKPVPGPEMPIPVVLVGRTQFLEEYSQVADALVGALNEAKAWIKQNPDEAKDTVSKETGISREVIDLAWPKLDWSAELDTVVIADIQNKANFFAEIGSLRRKVDVHGELIYDGLK